MLIIMKDNTFLIPTLLLCLSVCSFYVVHGAWLGQTKPATFPVKKMVEVLQRDIKRKLPNGYYAGKPLPQFDAISFRTQVDFGMNYFIKVKTAPEMYIHVKIHRDRSHVARVRGVQVDKTLTEPIQAF